MRLVQENEKFPVKPVSRNPNITKLIQWNKDSTVTPIIENSFKKLHEKSHKYLNKKSNENLDKKLNEKSTHNNDYNEIFKEENYITNNKNKALSISKKNNNKRKKNEENSEINIKKENKNKSKNKDYDRKKKSKKNNKISNEINLENKNIIKESNNINNSDNKENNINKSPMRNNEMERSFLIDKNKKACTKICHTENNYNQIPKTAESSYCNIKEINCIFKIPARSEKIIKIPFKSNEDMIFYSQEIKPGVFLSNTLTRVTNEQAPIAILNSNEEEVEISNFKIFYNFLDNYDIKKINNKNKSIQINYFRNNNSHSRNKKINGNEKYTHTPHNQSNLLNTITTTHENTQIDEQRIHNLKNSLKFPEHLNPEELLSLQGICTEFNDVFHLAGDKLSYTTAITHSIPLLPGKGPINQKMYRLPEIQREIVNTQVKEMLENDIIKPSKSPFNSPLLVVPKKPGPDGEKRWRVVVDFRKLNEITIKDVFPLPRIDEILDQLGHSRYFTTLDLASGYHQVLVDEKDREKTAFSTYQGHYEFKRMPFGLTGAPATFQRLMNNILTAKDDLNILVYLDDVVIYGRNLEDHNNKLRRVFQIFREHNLKLQPEKCNFLMKEVVYLGHKCSEEGIKPDPQKISCVLNFPTPKNVRQVQSFLGLANYYRKFIQNFSKIAEPINKLLRKDSKFHWNPQCDAAFNELKTILTNPPLLIYPDYSKPFILTTDASGEALGAVLSQGEPGNERPIAYASRTLNDAERRYSTIEREMLAIVWSTKNFRCYLYGRPFTVYTDHKPLVEILKLKDTTSRLARFQIKLFDYDLKIEYKAGKNNQNADALSRIPEYKNESPVIQDEKPNCNIVTRSAAKSSDNNQNNEENSPQSEDSIEIENDQEINETQEKNDKAKYLTDKSEIQTILFEYHNTPLGGHTGVLRTFKRIRPFYRWKNMLKDIQNYIKKCEKCQKNKTGKQLKMPMVITDTPDQPFDKVCLDILGPFPATENQNKYILTFQDDLTKLIDCIPLQDCEAITVATKFYQNIILKYAIIPRKLLTDQGANFTSELFKNLCKLLKIKKIQTSAYHPQSNGSLERSHGPLVEYLRTIIDNNPTKWDEWLGEAALVHNHTPHTGTKHTPIQALYGINRPLPTNLQKEPEPIYNFDNYCNYVKYKMQQIHTTAKKNLILQKQNSKAYYDKNTRVQRFHVGDKVLLKNNARKHKLSPIWTGPYEVKSVNNEVNTTIKIGRKLKVIHNNRLRLF